MNNVNIGSSNHHALYIYTTHTTIQTFGVGKIIYKTIRVVYEVIARITLLLFSIVKVSTQIFFIVLHKSCEMSPIWQQKVIIHELRHAGEYVSLSDFRSKSD